MKKSVSVILLIGLLNLLSLRQIVYGQQLASLGKSTVSSNVGSVSWVQKPEFGKSKAFVENKGQCADDLDGINGNDILYKVDDDGMQVYFTKHTIIYKTNKRVKVSHEEWENYCKEHNIAEKGIDKDEAAHYINKSSTVSMEWVNGNTDVTVNAEALTTGYFNYYRPDIDKNKIIGNVRGYKKLVYKNIYPGIDIEYTIADNEGIKYAYVLQPGADASLIKMKYNGIILKQDAHKNILIPTEYGDITDHAPDTYTGTIDAQGKKIRSSFVLLNNNTVGFKLAENKSNNVVIIDPWITGPKLTNVGKAFIGDIAVDVNDNSVINGVDTKGAANYLQQYNSAGTLVWTVVMSTKYGYITEQGDVQVDAAGNIYVTTGLNGGPGSNYNTIKLNSAGNTLLWGNTTPGNSTTNMYETWTLAFDCSQANLIQSGGGMTGGQSDMTTYYNIGVFEPISSATGTEGPLNHNVAFGEIVDSRFAGNGMLYSMSADSNVDAGDTTNGGFYATGNYNRLICSNPGAGYAQVFNVRTGFDFQDGWSKEGAGSSIGFNSIGSSCDFLYITDGLTLQQRNLTTGALITSVKITGGNNTASSSSSSDGVINGGIVTDMCGDVYIGSSKAIYEYSPTLASMGAVGGVLPGTVYDMALGNKGQTIYVCGGENTTSFIAAVNVLPCKGVTAVVTAPIGCGSLASATATPTFCSGPYTYSWVPGGQTAATATNLAAGTYTVTVTGSADCQFAFQDTAIVNVPATTVTSFTINTSSTPSACAATNGTASVTSVSGGTGPFTYSWSTTPAQTTSVASGLAPGIYQVVVAEAGGCKDSVKVTVASSGATITPTVSATPVLCFGGSTGTASVTNVSGGATPYTYSWSNTSTATNINALTAGVYTLTVTDANGCEGTVTDTIKQPLQLTLTAASFAATCNGLCNGSATSIPKGGTGPYIYSWSNTGTGANITSLCAGTYSLAVTDANGCSIDTTGLVITQPAAITNTVTPTPAGCGQANGQACITANGGATPYTYSWSTVPAQTTTCITNVIANTYTVIVTDANKCNDTATVTINNIGGDTAEITASSNVTCNGGSNGTAIGGAKGGTAPYTYSWSTTPAQTNSNATGLAAGNYTVTVKDNIGCISTATVTITQPAAVVLTPGPPQTICIGDSALLTASAVGGTAPYTYTWTPGGAGSSISVKPTSTTTYNVIATDSNKCVSRDTSVIVTVNPPLTVTVSPNQSVCPGGSMNFTATASGGDGTYTYSWAPGGYASSAITVSPAATTVYTITLSDACGTAPVKDSVTATVNPQPVVNFTADTTMGCSKLCVTFKNNSTNDSICTWNYGDGGGSNATKPSQYCYSTAGVFTVSLLVVSNKGCKDSLTIPNMITVYSHPVASFTYSPQPVNILVPTVYFKDLSTDNYGPISSWFWEFGDPLDGSSIIQNPNYTYADTGDYCITEVVANKYGCLDSVKECLDVEPIFTFYIPNAFSPNHDGENDVFMPTGTYVCGYSMYIFDRWGQLLFHSTDMAKGWDGTVGGVKAQEDTYVYLITATDCVQHNQHQYIGRVTLVK